MSEPFVQATIEARQTVQMAHRHGALVLIDGAQAVSHMHVDVQDLDCDWYPLSGHKVFGPTGIGVLYGKSELLNTMPPWQGGGNMIQDVTFEQTLYQPAPVRFEAGTGSIADAIGLEAAVDYLQRIGIENVHRYEQDVLAYATKALGTVPGLHLIGTAPEKASVLRSCSTATNPRPSARPWTRKASPSAPVTTAPSQSSAASDTRALSVPRSRSTTPAPRLTPWSRR